MRKIKTAVITGATGMIGVALTRFLLAQGITVVACIRAGSKKIERLLELEQNKTEQVCDTNDNGTMCRGCLHIIEADLEELRDNRILEEILSVVKQADAFFHLGWSGTFGEERNHMFLQNINIRCTLDAVYLAKRIGCQVFVGVGSQAEYGRVPDGEQLKADMPVFPENGYGIAKLAAGQMSRIVCRELGICHVWLRVLSVYGAWDTERSMVMSAINTLLAGGRPQFSKGEQLWDYLYVKDAARALFLAAKFGLDGQIYPLGSGQAIPLKEYIQTIRDIVAPSAQLGIGELPYAKQQVMYLCADIEELTKDTGFRPEYTFAEGIRETAMWQIGRKNEENQCSNSML